MLCTLHMLYSIQTVIKFDAKLVSSKCKFMFHVIKEKHYQ